MHNCDPYQHFIPRTCYELAYSHCFHAGRLSSHQFGWPQTTPLCWRVVCGSSERGHTPTLSHGEHPWGRPLLIPTTKKYHLGARSHLCHRGRNQQWQWMPMTANGRLWYFSHIKPLLFYALDLGSHFLRSRQKISSLIIDERLFKSKKWLYTLCILSIFRLKCLSHPITYAFFLIIQYQ